MTKTPQGNIEKAPPTRGWSIKRIETEGILDRLGEVWSSPLPGDELAKPPRYLKTPDQIWPSNSEYFFEKIGTEVFLTREEAVAAGKIRLKRKVSALDKKRAKLLKLLETL